MIHFEMSDSGPRNFWTLPFGRSNRQMRISFSLRPLEDCLSVGKRSSASILEGIEVLLAVVGMNYAELMNYSAGVSE